jgi:hypothetical protein
MGGYRPFALTRHEKLVRNLVAAQSDLALEELRDRLADAGEWRWAGPRSIAIRRRWA